jgi:hypothetical protein
MRVTSRAADLPLIVITVVIGRACEKRRYDRGDQPLEHRHSQSALTRD